MEQATAQRTVLRLSTRNELDHHAMTSHGARRFRDTGYGADGRRTTSETVSIDLKEGQHVNRVSVDRDYEGNLYITLEE